MSVVVLSFVASLAFGLPCMTGNSQFASFGKIVEPIHVIGKVDDRGELPDRIKSLKLTKDQERQLRTSLGALYCPPDSLHPEPVALTAFLAGSTGEIVSAAHGIVDDWGAARDLNTCWFENFELPKPRRISINANSPRNILPNQNPGLNNSRNDKVRLALKSPIKNAKPFVFDAKENGMESGADLILAAAQLNDFKSSGKHPIVGSCQYMSDWNLNDGQGRFRTNCNQDKGGSGGPVLVRRGNELVVKGIAIWAPYKLPNGQPYSESNSVINLSIDSDFLD